MQLSKAQVFQLTSACFGCTSEFDNICYQLFNYGQALAETEPDVALSG